jgi:hypothetical protein
VFTENCFTQFSPIHEFGKFQWKVLHGDGARKLADGAELICNSESLCVVMTSPLGTPRGRYDECSG